VATPLPDRIIAELPKATAMYSKLVLLVGPPRSEKTGALNELAARFGWPRINVSLQLSERLLDLTQKQRAVRVAGLLDDIVKVSASDVVLLDNIELLFAVELSQDPLRLMQSMSRNRTVISSWPGTFDGQVLTYAEPGHREFKKYVAPQATIVSTADAQTTDAAPAQAGTR